jgi:hypothetical protein
MEDKMEINEFFDFSSKLVSSTFQAGAIGIPKGAQGELIMGEYAGIDFPVIFMQEYGHKLTDILDTGYTSLCLISDRLKILLEENGFTGWKCFPIRLFDKKKNEVLGYHGFSITGRCGPIDRTKSTIIEKQRASGWPMRKFYKGLYIGLDTWDNTDFFIPKGSAWPIITKKVADVLKKNKITNLCMENLADIECEVGH